MRYSDEDIKRFLLKVEADVHRAGWEMPPVLAGVTEIRPGVLKLGIFPVTLQNPVGEHIRQIGEQFNEPGQTQDLVKDIIDTSPGPFFGIAFISEVWGNDSLTPAEGEAWYASGKKLADHPASIEARQMTVVNVYGGVHSVMRTRNKKPIVEDFQFTGGRQLHGLFDMLKALVVYVPDEDCDRKAVQALHSLTNAESGVEYERLRSDNA